MTTFLRPSKKSLKNAQHFEFIDAFITLLVAAGLSSAKIAALLSELQTAFGEENRLYMIARASEIIAQRDEADRDRDDKYSRLHAIIRAWAGSGNPTLDAAATAVKKPFEMYKVKTAAQIDEESGQLDNLITDLSTNAMQQNLTSLGVMWLYEQMVSAHQLTKSLRLEQGVEESVKLTGALKAARQACDALYDKITYMIEAFTLTADDPAPYEAFIKRWNGTLKIYQDMLDRKSGTTSSGGSSSNSGGFGQQGGTTNSGNSGTTEPGGSNQNENQNQGGGSNQNENQGGGSNENQGGTEQGGGDNGGGDNGGGDNGGGDNNGGGGGGNNFGDFN